MTIVIDGTNGISGVDGTASNPAYEGTDSNTGLFYPAADTVGIATGGTERLRVDSAGNAGLGVTPSAWGTTEYKAAQIGNGASFYGRVQSGDQAKAGFSANAYNDNTNWRYIASYAASRYDQLSGGHYWYTAASGTAGNAITFTQAMTLDASGNLIVGGTTANGLLTIGGNTTRYFAVGSTGVATLRFDDNGTQALNLQNYGITGANQGYQVRWQFGDSSTNAATAGSIAVQTDQAWTSASSSQDAYMQFAVALNGTNTERARITSGGILLINTTAAIEGASNLQVRGGIMGDNSSGDANFAIEARGVGTLYSDSIYSSTTAAGASVSITGTAGYLQRSTSSIKYKTNVEDLDQSRSEVIFQMRPVWYRSICELDRKDWSYYGLIAEEVAEIEPRLVHWGKVKEDGSQEPEGVMYDRLTVLLLTEMKKLKAELDATKAEVAALKGTA